MLDDIFIGKSESIPQGPIVGHKVGSVTIETGVSLWEADKRREFSDINVSRCSASMISVGPVVLRDCRVEDSKTTRHFAQFYGTAFSQCSFHGNCGRVWIEDASKLTLSMTNLLKNIDQANRVFYEDVDIALDISDAWFSDFEIMGIPLSKVVIDPDRQLKCSAEKAAKFGAQAARDLDMPAGDLLAVYIETYCIEKNSDFLVASPKSGKNRDRFLELQAICTANDLTI